MALYQCALCNISPAEHYVTTRVVWVTKLGKKKKNDALSVSVPYSRCLGFTSGAALNPNLQLEAPDGRLIAFICCIARKENTAKHIRKRFGAKLITGPHNFIITKSAIFFFVSSWYVTLCARYAWVLSFSQRCGWAAIK